MRFTAVWQDKMNTPTETTSIRILLAGQRDQPCQLFRAAFEATPDMRVVAQVKHGKDLLKYLARIDLDVVLADVQTPHMQGQDTASWVAEVNPRVATAVFALCADNVTVFLAARFGAAHELITGIGMTRALEIIRAIAQEQKRRDVKTHGWSDPDRTR